MLDLHRDGWRNNQQENWLRNRPYGDSINNIQTQELYWRGVARKDSASFIISPAVDKENNSVQRITIKAK